MSIRIGYDSAQILIIGEVQMTEKEKTPQQTPESIPPTNPPKESQTQQRPKIVLGGPGGIAWIAGENPPSSAP